MQHAEERLAALNALCPKLEQAGSIEDMREILAVVIEVMKLELEASIPGGIYARA